MKPGEHGLPKTDASARTLGARANIDIPVNEDETVGPEMEGMSASPPPLREPQPSLCVVPRACGRLLARTTCSTPPLNARLLLPTLLIPPLQSVCSTTSQLL